MTRLRTPRGNHSTDHHQSRWLQLPRVGILLAVCILYALSSHVFVKNYVRHFNSTNAISTRALKQSTKYFAPREGEPWEEQVRSSNHNDRGKQDPNNNQQDLRQTPPLYISYKNRGIFEGGKWKSQRNPDQLPPLFMDRLNKHLPECPETKTGYGDADLDNTKACDDNIRLFPDDVAKMEEDILKFDIPRPIIIHFHEDAEYVSIIHWRWKNYIDRNHDGTMKMCPNCHIRHAHEFLESPDEENEPAHIRIHSGCADLNAFHNYREHPNQIIVGDCGESQDGTGSPFYRLGIDAVDYDTGFLDRGGPFVRTYAHLHLSPGNIYSASGLPELSNVTDFVRLLLQPPPAFPRHTTNPNIVGNLTGDPNAMPEDASFLHNNCWGNRGFFVKNVLIDSAETNVTVACYGTCFHNKEPTEVMPEISQENWFHGDCEAHRDSSKTALASYHKFSFALENTASPYYFTEKRYQSLLAASAPIVWDNDNSAAFLPDPDAAVLVPPTWQRQDARELGELIHMLALPENEAEYLDTLFAWKKRGLRPDFVRKLFQSTDFITCRLCEYMAHHHFYDEDDATS